MNKHLLNYKDLTWDYRHILELLENKKDYICSIIFVNWCAFSKEGKIAVSGIRVVWKCQKQVSQKVRY